jgi:hypothetical protein
MDLSVIEIKPFVPACRLSESIAFYAALGFEVPWQSDDLAYVRLGGTSFMLQKFYVPEHANNFVMHMLVGNADDWHRHVVDSGVVEKYAVRLDTPEDRPWQLRDFTLTDPSGVLWRIGHEIADRCAG